MKGRACTPEQKRAVIERILAAWEKEPDLRLGQLILNAAIMTGNVYPKLFYVEDETLAEWLERVGPLERDGP